MNFYMFSNPQTLTLEIDYHTQSLKQYFSIHTRLTINGIFQSCVKTYLKCSLSGMPLFSSELLSNFCTRFTNPFCLELTPLSLVLNQMLLQDKKWVFLGTGTYTKTSIQAHTFIYPLTLTQLNITMNSSVWIIF